MDMDVCFVKKFTKKCVVCCVSDFRLHKLCMNVLFMVTSVTFILRVAYDFSGLLNFYFMEFLLN